MDKFDTTHGFETPIDISEEFWKLIPQEKKYFKNEVYNTLHEISPNNFHAIIYIAIKYEDEGEFKSKLLKLTKSFVVARKQNQIYYGLLGNPMKLKFKDKSGGYLIIYPLFNGTLEEAKNIIEK